MEAGYTKPVALITMVGKQELRCLMVHFTLFRNKAVLDQLKGGLCILGVADAMLKYSSLLAPFFVAGKQTPLTAG